MAYGFLGVKMDRRFNLLLMQFIVFNAGLSVQKTVHW